jgi:hypothetical protein
MTHYTFPNPITVESGSQAQTKTYWLDSPAYRYWHYILAKTDFLSHLSKEMK